MRFTTPAEKRLADAEKHLNTDNPNVLAILELAKKYVNPDVKTHQLPAVVKDLFNEDPA